MSEETNMGDLQARGLAQSYAAGRKRVHDLALAQAAKLPLERARRIAAKAVELLRPYCAKIEIAGSIRRQRPSVADVDLVLELNPHMQGAFRAWLHERGPIIVSEGKDNIIVQGRHCQVDLFLARSATHDLLAPVAGNWGSLLLCRTGSKEHNVKLVQRAKELGKRWAPYEGVYAGGQWTRRGEENHYEGGRLAAWESEADIFTALEMELVPPEKRE